ncbi:hypothetical protein BDD12DRAFT_976977 [Trichophaea hybrida]|nr:hypothetical protein BDD12DRAFT_976977 [Trichophaea hybrida]
MAETKAATPVIKAEKEDYNDANTTRESSDLNSPPGGISGQPRKRKYEEATEEEKQALNTYHLSNPHLKQRELAEWFKTQYGKSINQSTVSRNLKKFKASPPPPNKPRGSRPPQSTPTRRERKPTNPSQKKIQTTKQLPPLTPSAVSLPPTPPPRDSKSSPIDVQLYEFYTNYMKQNPEASPAECDKQIKSEAQRLIAGLRPPPPPEKIDEPIDDAWVANWKRNCVLMGPSAGTTPNDCLGFPASGSPNRVPLQEPDRTRSEETEPRSPVSTVSSIERRSSLELPPMKTSPPDAASSIQQLPGSTQLANGTHDRDARKRKIEELKKDIVKRDQRIEHEQRKKESSMRKLEKLEGM